MESIAYAYGMAGFQDVDLRHLQALRAVAEEGSFGRAGARLGFSQAAISQQIAGLERALGVTVFDRPGGPRPVRLTPAGRVLLRHAEAVLERLATADLELADLRAGKAGRLAIATFQSVAVRLLPGLIARIKAESPDLDIRVHQVDDTGEALALIDDGTVDAAFVETFPDRPDLSVDLVLQDPFVVLVPAGDPSLSDLAPGGPYPVERLAHRSMVGQGQCDASRQLEVTLSLMGVASRFVFRTQDNTALQAMVRAGVGVAVAPLLAVDEADPGVSIRLADPPLGMREVVVIRPRGAQATAAAERLAELAVEAGGRANLSPRGASLAAV